MNNTVTNSVGTLSQFPNNQPRKFTIDGEDVLVVNVDGEVFAVNDTCTHGAVSLSEGEIDQCAIECWLHGSSFDLRTGAPKSLPATAAIETYAVTMSQDSDPEIFVSLSSQGVSNVSS